MSFEDHDVRGVLARASEIDDTTLSQVDVEALILAAEEVGISRSAVERALRERMAVPMRTPAVGDLVFARSVDERYYAAEVLAASSDVTVRYLRGGEHAVQPHELRPYTLLPGERVVVDWPWWGQWTCTVLSYDAVERRVTVTDGWGETRAFPVSEIWLAPPRRGHRSRRNRLIAALLAAGSAGALLGAYLASVLGG